MKTFAIGDIHGRNDALLQCLERSGFDKDHDLLIVLGDVCDGGDQVKDVIETLLTLHTILIKGNHDEWMLDWMLTGVEVPHHYHQGGIWSMKSYSFDKRNVPQSHIDYLKSAKPYFIDERNNVYCHGGFDERYPIEDQNEIDIMWDRDLIYKYGRKYATHPIERYNHVFVGHTSTQGIKHDWEAVEPIHAFNVTALDTGGGWNGKLTIMDIDTFEYWQSDIQTPKPS